MKKAILATIILCTLPLTFAENIRGINIEFVNIGNLGNTADNNGYGSVDYNYRIGTYEITNSQWNTFTSDAGFPTGNPNYAYDEGARYTNVKQPTGYISWYEAAQFCNYLTSGDKSKGAYQFSGNNSNPGNFLGINRTAAISTYGTIYVIPTENEWYKAAYYKPDGSGYSIYANGTDIEPIPGVDTNYKYWHIFDEPWDVGTGTMEQNGTYDIMGNIWEWTETPIYNFEYIRRGGSFYDPGIPDSPASYIRITFPQDGEIYDVGIRVVSIPEPATLFFLGLGVIYTSRKRSR